MRVCYLVVLGMQPCSQEFRYLESKSEARIGREDLYKAQQSHELSINSHHYCRLRNYLSTKMS